MDQVVNLIFVVFVAAGAFRVEMQRESQKDRTILCKYEPTEPGDYRIEVKWSGEHVPGSPFMVMIFDTQEELSRFLQVRALNQIYKISIEVLNLTKVFFEQN